MSPRWRPGLDTTPRDRKLATGELDSYSTATRQELDRIALDSSTKLDSYSTDLDSYELLDRNPPDSMRLGVKVSSSTARAQVCVLCVRYRNR